MKKPSLSRRTKETQFSALFEKHYTKLYNYAYKVLKTKNVSEELVQETFIKLWAHFEDMNGSQRSIESFLIVTLKNKIIDDFRKNEVRDKHTNLYTQNTNFQTELDTQWEISKQVDLIYRSLEPTVAETFRLSRDKGLTYKEISTKKNISVKTVELHISKGLKAFREGLKEYL